jgi:hypothetical protein
MQTPRGPSRRRGWGENRGARSLTPLPPSVPRFSIFFQNCIFCGVGILLLVSGIAGLSLAIGAGMAENRSDMILVGSFGMVFLGEMA